MSLLFNILSHNSNKFYIPTIFTNQPLVIKMSKSILLLCISSLMVYFVSSAPLQDFCVANPAAPATGNGLACKNPALVKADDFFFSGLQFPGNTSNPYGASIIPATLATVPGLNTLGLSLARLDFAPFGIIPPHTHPRAFEIITVLEGFLKVGFIASNPTYNHFFKVLKKGDVFVVPTGLVHYQYNPGPAKTVAIAALNSESPGIVAIPNSIFGAKPDLDARYLAKAFQMDLKVVQQLLAKF